MKPYGPAKVMRVKPNIGCMDLGKSVKFAS